MLSIYIKEFSGFFSSLTAYIIIGLFLVVSGLFLWVFPESSVLDYGYAGLDSFFNLAPYLFMFLIPAITMRTISEELRDGTFELLATRPLNDWEIILGKYFACLTIVVCCLLLTLIYYYSVYQLGLPTGNIDTGAVIGSYLGLILLSASFTALGLFASSLGKNQIIAFSIAVFLSFFSFSGFDSFSRILSLEQFSVGISWLGISEHYESVSRGVLDTRDFIYFVSFSFLFLLITKTIMGGRKW